uniref:Putative ovule protein n=1 Tax=Solanum chacoense TaxID=4108 RepID=A0A0V0GH71_SOLCH
MFQISINFSKIVNWKNNMTIKFLNRNNTSLQTWVSTPKILRKEVEMVVHDLIDRLLRVHLGKNCGLHK